MYELGPLPDHATFRPLATGWDDCGPDITSLSLCGDRLVIYTTDELAVWDFVSRRCVWWPTPESLELDDLENQRLPLVSQFQLVLKAGVCLYVESVRRGVR